MTAPSAKIAIIGAGPSGLTLARILRNNGINVTVFEGDESPNVRGQGGTLDLHPGTGQEALKRAGLFDEFEKHARHDAENLVVADRFGTEHIRVGGIETGRPEIDRTMLRQILLDSLPADAIKWNHRLKSAEIGKLHFSHGTEEGFDLIVGADGAWSKIRPLVTAFQPFYSSISILDVWLTHLEKRNPGLDKMIGSGSYFACGEEDERAILSQRLSDGTVRSYLCMKKPENWIEDCGIDFLNAAEVRKAMLEEFRDWAPNLKEIITTFDDENITPRPLYMMPPGARWPSKKGVTLMGDAFHLMTPFAGEGVNAAMTGAMNLAAAVDRNPQNINKAVEEYEAEMFPLAAKVTNKTWANLLSRFDRGGIQDFAKVIQRWADSMKDTLPDAASAIKVLSNNE